MFPPLTSSLSLDAYLLRFGHPIRNFKKVGQSAEVRENRRLRKRTKTFLITLVAEVLRERLRQAAEDDIKSVQEYLQKHQWNVLKATGNNQVLIDLIYPRVSESLGLTSWGPLLVCLILKAVKCLTKEELAEVKVVEKLCRKYITKYRCSRRKGLRQLKQDWDTVCTCSQKLADSARNAKLIKSVRNFIDEAALQPTGNGMRPRSAPARIDRKAEVTTLSFKRRPATASLSRDKMAASRTTGERLHLDFLRQRQMNYHPPKQLVMPITLNEIIRHGKEFQDSTKDGLNEKHTPKIKKRTAEKSEASLKLDRAALEARIRKFCGRIRSPVPIPRTAADISPTQKPFRLKPLKVPSTAHTSERGLVVSALPRIPIKESTNEPHSEMVTLTNEKSPHQKEIARLVAGEKQTRTHYQSTKTISPGQHSRTSQDPVRTRPMRISTATTKQGFRNRQMKQLVNEAIKLRRIEDVAANSLLGDKEFIDAFFDYLARTNTTAKFLKIKNNETQTSFEKADGGKAQFSFLHYCLYYCAAEDQASDKNPGEYIYIVKKVIKELACSHKNQDDAKTDCWKCGQKGLAMEIAISLGKTEMCKLLLHEGVQYQEEHLTVAIQTNNIVEFKQIIGYLKEKEIWNPSSPCVKHTLHLARVCDTKAFVAVLQSEGVQDKSEIVCMSCLPFFT